MTALRKLISDSSIILLTVLPLFLFSCKKETEDPLPVDPVPINITADQVSVINSGNKFALDIFKRVLADAGDTQNIIISPLSISSALSMVLNGANGATRDSITEALRLNGLTPEAVNSAYKSLTEALLKVDSRVNISIANSIWTEKNFVVKKPFADVLNQYYNTEANSFDITDPKVVVPINAWIDAKTNGLIKNMIDQLDPSTVMLLINAIYFKGKWNFQFSSEKTMDDSFIKSDGETVQVPMMKQTNKFGFFQGEGFSMAEFPYGQGNYVMDVILPVETNGIKDLMPMITNDNLNNWLSMMNENEIDVSFPRFKYTFKKELKEILSDMGMGVAFTDFADFSNIAQLNLAISFVLHQAFIENNEEGTEAAAATVVGIINTSMPVGPKRFSIDHPFIYIIRETTTNSILFMGRVSDPLTE